MYPQNQNIDDLFRKAAARYPLSTSNGDWEKVAGKLNPSGKPITRAGRLRRNNYLWLLLLPASFIFHNSFEHTAIAKHHEKSSLHTVPVKQVNKKPDVAVVTTEQKSIETRTSSLPQHNKQLAASLPHTISYHVLLGTISSERSLTDTKKPDLPKADPKHTPRFYLGVAAGVDLGTVKGQSFTDPGINVGLLAGYRFNRHWSFESGVYYVRKKYFTRGEHFSMKKIESSMPGMEMVTVKGQLSLFEIPYKLKYDFLLKERSNFFITAGGSSNIYIKEDNEYFTRQNGIQQLHKASYSDIHCSPLCLVHVSGGYEHILRNNTRLRLEPYIKFPLRKVGMGSVQVLSVGLNVSVSNFLGKQDR